MNTQVIEETRQLLTRRAPSVLTEYAHHNTSDKYNHFSTWGLIQTMLNEGFKVTKANEQCARSIDRKGFQKHEIRLRHTSTEAKSIGDSLLEIILTNSHDGKSSYTLQAGLFRLICSNGLTVSESTFEPIRIRHVGATMSDVIDASFKVIEELPRLQDSVKQFQSITLTDSERLAFGKAALQLKYDADENTGVLLSPVTENRIIQPRRYEDQKSDLWSTFNVVQENLIKGGQRGLMPVILENGRISRRRATVREVKGIDQNNKLNKALWSLAEEMKKIKSVA